MGTTEAGRIEQAKTLVALCEGDSDYAYDLIYAYANGPYPATEAGPAITSWMRRNVRNDKDAYEIEAALETL